MIIQTECVRESSCKHYKTTVLVEKNVAAFWLATFYGRFRKKSMFLDLTNCLVLAFSQWNLIDKFRCLITSLNAQDYVDLGSVSRI